MVEQNKPIIDEFTKLLSQIENDINKSETEKEAETHRFRMRNISSGLKAIKRWKTPIKSSSDLEGIPGVGKGIKRRIDEILSTGKLSEIKLSKEEETKITVLNELREVIGIGERTALELYDEGIRSVKQLKQEVKSKKVYVNDIVKLGLKYHGVFKKTIPRKEMKSVEKLLKDIAHEISPQLYGEVLGSYRRQHPTSNDIDFMITHPSIKTKEDLMLSNKNYLKKMVNKLTEEGYIIDHITGKDVVTNYRGFFQLDENHPVRRIDLKMIPYNSYPTALLHFTGSDKFNERIRLVAKQKGYKLSEYGLFKQDKLKGTQKQVMVKDENDIFKKLGLKYVAPKDRDF